MELLFQGALVASLYLRNSFNHTVTQLSDAESLVCFYSRAPLFQHIIRGFDWVFQNNSINPRLSRLAHSILQLVIHFVSFISIIMLAFYSLIIIS